MAKGRGAQVLVECDHTGTGLGGARRCRSAAPCRPQRPGVMTSPRDESIYYRRSRFTTHLPRGRKYSPSHYWLLEESPGVWRVGFTKFATRMLGDIVEFEFSVTSGTNIRFGDTIGTIEGLKAVSSIFAAGSGVFLGEGAGLRADVTRADFDPYGEGWL